MNKKKPTGISRKKFVGLSVTGLVGLAQLLGNKPGQPGIAESSPGQITSNPITIENALPGSTGWRLSNISSDTICEIKGYASATSVNKGDSVDLYVTVNIAQTYTIEVYRMGWYNGAGGRLMQTSGPLTGSPQTIPAPNADGTVICDWVKSYTLIIPDTWVSGQYLLKLKNANGYDNYIHLVVRDDTATADLLFQSSVLTYQAYNGFGGKSLYTDSSTNGIPAVKVSFDRPYDGVGCGLFGSYEYPLLYFIEQAGFYVTYCSNIDFHNNPALPLKYKAFLSTGHDEYWSKAMYDGALAARDAKIHLGFFGANACYWQIRLENSAKSVPNRIVVGYKERYAQDPLYGVNNALVTGRWQDDPINRPENQLIGSLFDSNVNTEIGQPYIVQNSYHWVYENTGFKDGDSVPGIVGYEWDKVVNNGLTPAGLTVLSNSPVVDYNNVSSTANAAIYQAGSHAWVFSTGTIYWSQALQWPDTFYPYNRVNTQIQQTTLNVLNRFISFDPSWLIVTNPIDRGAVLDGEIAGTLSFALKKAAGGDNISFQLPSNSIQVQGKLPDIPKGVTLNVAATTRITLDGSATPANTDGLVLTGNNSLYNLEVKNFKGRQIVGLGGNGGNKVNRVTVTDNAL